MLNNFFGYKSNQIQTFTDKGKRMVVTKILANPGIVQRIKDGQKDGYKALVVKVPAKGWSASGRKNNFILREIRVEEPTKFKIGDELTVDQVFKVGQRVQVSGKSKGKGFAGVVKRWGFAGGPHTHGQSDRERAPGAIGQRTDPGRVWKGKRMAGRMGNAIKTIKGLQIFKVEPEKNLLLIEGVIPGAKGGLVEISKRS